MPMTKPIYRPELRVLGDLVCHAVLRWEEDGVDDVDDTVAGFMVGADDLGIVHPEARLVHLHPDLGTDVYSTETHTRISHERRHCYQHFIIAKQEPS